MPHMLKVAALQLPNLTPYRKNLDAILHHVEALSGHDILLAPEVSLTDYDYDNLEAAAAFGTEAIEMLCRVVGTQVLGLTLLTRHEDGRYTNDAVVIHDHRVVHRQSKHKLFLLGEEDKHLSAGSQEGIQLFEINGVRYGMMICFELRFKELWKQLEGADVILVPSQWGMPRKRHLEILAQALAVMNQAYVVVANSSKTDMASSTAIYSPNGGVVMDDMQTVITGEIDFGLLKKMRRYIVMK
jgi:predicted amidohydrolase